MESSSAFLKNPCKKVKLSDQLDPFVNIFEELHELLLQHFNVSEVLNLSLVSRSWCFILERSTKCCEKLEINIEKPTEEFSSSDFSSCRRYQQIRVNLWHHRSESIFTKILPELMKILQGRKWKKVILRSFTYEKKNDLIDLMKLIEPTVEHLNMCSVGPTRSHQNVMLETDEKLLFNQLKYVELNGNGIFKDIVRNCKNLETAVLGPNLLDQSTIDDILTNNVKLKSLTLGLRSPIMSLEKTKDYRFKLKRLNFVEFSFIQVEDWKTIIKFLKTQAGNLEEMKLSWSTVQSRTTVLQAIFKLPKLKRLHLHKYRLPETMDWDTNDKLTQNSTIEEFKFIDDERNLLNESTVRQFENLLTAMPNLRSFSWLKMDGSACQSLNRFFPKLEKITTIGLAINSIDELSYFPNLKSFHTCVFKKEIIDQIQNKPMGLRTPFETLALMSQVDDGMDWLRCVHWFRESSDIFHGF